MFPYRVPKFNANVSIYNGQAINGTMPIGGPVGAPSAYVECQVRGVKWPGQWTNNNNIKSDGENPYYAYKLAYMICVPKGTALLSPLDAGGPSLCVVDVLGPGVYVVAYTMIVAAGFPNEYFSGHMIICSPEPVEEE